MERDERFALLAIGDAEAIMTLAETLLDTTDVTLIMPPRVGMVMLQMRDPVAGETFYAGEVLVTEAQVTLGGHDGYAMRFGREPEPTLAAAILDAALEAGHMLTPQILAHLTATAAAEQERQRADWHAVIQTRLAFDLDDRPHPVAHP